ncbi:MAG: FAD-dependent monooxygenase [Clostridia bacterium]|nr:FAD-dependent monooxygenase [Clostridia bacterium]
MSQRTLLVPSITLPLEAGEREAIAVAQSRLRRYGVRSSTYIYRIYRRSVDARKREDIRFVYSVAVSGDFSVSELSHLASLGITPLPDDGVEVTRGTDTLRARPIVVGTGPAGLFAAMILAENGYRPLVLERGGTVAERVRAAEIFVRNRVLDPNVNIQFGAGGAGTFSDGKLITRVNDPRCSYVLSRLAEFGAPADITVQAKPHIGTDYLRTVVSRMLAYIEEKGGEVRYHATLTDLRLGADGVQAACVGGEWIPCGALILAIGHSARDTYAMLLSHGIAIEPKPFSVGLRIEHLQEDIDRALYGKFAGHPALGHAEYTLSDRTGGRGVYTFCMCPGGEVVAAASETGGVVVNGMSARARNGKNANAAVAVSVDVADYGGTPECAIAFQRSIEQAAFAVGGADYSAPACLLGDFLAGKEGTAPSRILPSYMNGGVRLVSPDHYLPPFITDSLRYSLPLFEKRIRGYATPDAVLTGPETRTSAPVRILRNEARVSPSVTNLYPCGEGAGYAGGITSAALDGIHTALALCARFAPIS